MFQRGNEFVLGNITSTLSSAITMWNCFGRRGCNAELVRYIKQYGSDFPSPVTVLVPFDGPWVSLPRSIEWFQKYHANIQWVFSVRQHEQALQALNGHVCQVITVTETEISVPSDGYRKCSTRRLLTTAQDGHLRDRVPPLGTFAKNEEIRYAIHDTSTKLCFRILWVLEQLKDLHSALNNTLLEFCNDGGTDSLLFDRRVDFVVGVPSPKQAPSSYYRYATLPPFSVCFLTRRRGPIAPSFVSTWMSFFALVLLLAPLAAVITLVMSIKTLRRLSDAPHHSDWMLFYLSTYLGRCPPPLAKSSSASVRVASAAWMIGMFFLLQFTQTNITAQRSVPDHSPQVRYAAELYSLLDKGNVLPCVGYPVHELLYKFWENAAQASPILRSVEKCGKTCLSHNVEGDCIRRALNGTHVVVDPCIGMMNYGFPFGLVLGEESLLTYHRSMPTHSRYPLRHQHRRLLLMFEESGMSGVKKRRKMKRRHSTCPQCNTSVSFDLPFSSCMIVFFIGCCLSLLAFVIEVTHPPNFRSER
ncbi:hypothetical protein MTO96_012282 [Rhipicephalus appendiculatus]